MQDKQTYLKIIVNFVIMIALLILTIIFLPKLISFFWPFVLAFILSLIANPVVRFMEQRIHIKRKHGSAIIILVVILAIVSLILIVGYLLVKEAIRLIADLPAIFKAINELTDKLSERLSMLPLLSPNRVEVALKELISGASNWINQFVEGANVLTLTKAGNYVKNIGNAFFLCTITILSTYFFITYRDVMEKRVREIFPKSIITSMELVTSNFRVALLGYFKAQLEIMLILIVFMFFVFVFLNIQYAFFLSILIGFIDFLPVFGTGIILWPWALVDFINGNYIRAIIILGLYLICQIMRQILQPKLVGNSIKINSFTAVLFMYIGYRFHGVLGMILGIPSGLILVNFYRMGMFDRFLRGFRILFHDLNQFRKF